MPLGSRVLSAHVAGRSRVMDYERSMSAASPLWKDRVEHTSSVSLTMMVEGRRDQTKFQQVKQIAWAGLVSSRLADSLPDIAS